MLGIATPRDGYIAAAVFGIGIGGQLTLLPIAWADYYGRASYGAVRGIALSVQVLAQASGPLVSGILRDRSGGMNCRSSALRRYRLSALWRHCWRVPP